MLTIEQAQSYLDQAQQLIEQGKYHDAIALLEQAAPVFERVADWEGYVRCLNRWSECCWRVGSPAGLQPAENALQYYMLVYDEMHIERAWLYENLANCYEIHGRYEEAIAYHQKALPIKNTLLDEKNIRRAKTYSNIGLSYMYMYKIEEAISYFEQYHNLIIKFLPEDHKEFGGNYGNLGNCYLMNSQYKKAKEYYALAGDIFLKQYGEMHPAVALLYNNLGICQYRLNDYDAAINWHKKALAIYLQTLVGENYTTAQTYLSLANAYQEKGECDLSIMYIRKALSLFLKEFDEISHHVALCYDAMGLALTSKKEYDKAILFFQKAIEIFADTVGKEHQFTIQTQRNIAICFLHKNDIPNAIDKANLYLDYCLKNFDENIAEIAVTYDTLATFYLKQYESKIAYDYYQKAINIWRQILGNYGARLALAYINLGVMVSNQLNDYPQALHYYQLSLQALALNVPNDDYYPLPKLEGYNSAIDLLDMLPAKAATFTALYHQTQNPQDLSAALAHYQCADALIDQMRQSYKTEGSKLLLAEKGKDKVYDTGLEALWAAEQHS